MLTGLLTAGDRPTQVDKKHGMALYADGGCDQQSGVGGWGVHGYLYSADVPNKGIGCGSVIATDEGYCNKAVLGDRRSKEDLETLHELYKNPDAFKTAQPVTVIRYYDYFAGFREATNNIAELKAAQQALMLAIAVNEVTPLKEITLYCDSQYVIHGITRWIAGWQNNGWINGEGEPVANKEHWLELDSITNNVVSLGINVRWAWVRGHAGDVGNTQVDINATAGKVLGYKNITEQQRRESDASGYWNETIDRDRMFHQPNWYFNTRVPSNVLPDGRYVYCMGDHGKSDADEYVGRKSSESTYTLLYTANPNSEIETVKAYQESITTNPVPAFIVGKLAKLNVSRHALEIRQHGGLLLSRAKGRDNNLKMPNGDLITRELNPPRQSYTLVDTFGLLATLLQDFTSKRGEICVTEITDILYESTTVKKKEVKVLNKAITTQTHSLRVDVAYKTKVQEGVVPITLVVGKDMMDRNDLSAISSRDPKVYVVTWEESAVVFRYATIIDVGDAISITAAVYSNLKVLKETPVANGDFRSLSNLRSKAKTKISRHLQVNE